MSAERYLEQAFGDAAEDHFEWVTRAPGVAENERALVRAAFLPLGARVLDVGCAEGSTLFHLGEPEGAVGIDLFEPKVQFARQRLPRCRFVQGSAYALPFEDESFDHVLVRDVVHHLDTPSRMFAECRRVLSPGGRIDVLEPCRYNPLIFLHGLLMPAERGELRSTFPFLCKQMTPFFSDLVRRSYQALPLHRLVFHPELGRAQWGRVARVRRIVERAERLAERTAPRWSWAYLHVRGRATTESSSI
jgi:ubiquinone/menaquinone biosynthesis C-methylase UbiE